jgi:aryl-alcohol dehydrogenase-like predicted oxidoreductase
VHSTDTYSKDYKIGKRLVIGTANFGSEYGKRNKRIDPVEAEQVIHHAQGCDNVLIETGNSYAGAEELLAEILSGKEFPRLIVKISPDTYKSAIDMTRAVEKSLNRLGQTHAYAVLLHGAGEMFGNDQKSVQRGTMELLKSEITFEVGLTCYTIEEVSAAKKLFPNLTIFQLPENIVDQRKRTSRTLIELANLGNTFQVRSIFLQGLLLDQTQLPQRNEELNEIRKTLNYQASLRGISVPQLCLEYATSITWASDIVLGLESFEQYLTNLKILESSNSISTKDFGLASDFLVDPRNWS